MGTLAVEMHPLAQYVSCTQDELVVTLLDGRTVSALLAWFPRLAKASESEKSHWELLGNGQGIHWPEIDEDLSVAGLIAGTH